jgi:hypothetical protein
MQEECLIAPPARLEPVTQVRSTLLQSSLNTLRDQGLFARYEAVLETRYREQILGSLAPEWLPLSVAEAHYAACEVLGLSPEQMQRIGEAVGDRIQGTFLGTLVRRARTVGLTPWLLLGQFARLWERLMMGGGSALYKVGPKDARVEVHKLALARFAYFRAGFCGVIGAGIKLGAGRAVSVRISNARDFENRLVFRAAWV